MADYNIGARSDAPASIIADETAADATNISLLKAAKNILIDLSAASADLVVSSDALVISATALVAASDVAFSETAKITRPANVTQYAAGDVVGGAALEFAVAKANGGGGWINNAAFVSDNAPAATGQFFAWIFSAAPTVAADNAAFAPTDAELRTLVAFLTLDAAKKTANNTAYQQSDPRATYFVCGAATQSLWAVITDGNAYTPANGEVLDLTLFGTQE